MAENIRLSLFQQYNMPCDQMWSILIVLIPNPPSEFGYDMLPDK
jgi:hypothetical protein